MEFLRFLSEIIVQSFRVNHDLSLVIGVESQLILLLFRIVCQLNYELSSVYSRLCALPTHLWRVHPSRTEIYLSKDVSFMELGR